VRSAGRLITGALHLVLAFVLPLVEGQIRFGEATTMKKLIRSAATLQDTDHGTELVLRSSPDWLYYLSVSDESINVRVWKKSHEFRWTDIAWVGWTDRVPPTKEDKMIFLPIDLVLALVLRMPPVGTSSARSPSVRIAPKGSVLESPGPNTPYVLWLTGADAATCDTVRTFLAQMAHQLGVKYRTSATH